MPQKKGTNKVDTTAAPSEEAPKISTQDDKEPEKLVRKRRTSRKPKVTLEAPSNADVLVPEILNGTTEIVQEIAPEPAASAPLAKNRPKTTRTRQRPAKKTVAVGLELEVEQPPAAVIDNQEEPLEGLPVPSWRPRTKELIQTPPPEEKEAQQPKKTGRERRKKETPKQAQTEQPVHLERKLIPTPEYAQSEQPFGPPATACQACPRRA